MIKTKLILIFLFALLGCKSSQKSIHVKSDSVFDIEVASHQIKAFCSIPGDPQKKNYFISIYVFYDNKIANLFYRSVVTKKLCEANIKSIKRLLHSSKKVRTIAVEKLEGDRDSQLPILMKDPKLKYVDSYWKISRIMSENSCLDFFFSCKDPIDAEREFYKDKTVN